MTASVERDGAHALPAQSLGGRARAGAMWLIVGFGLGQVLRLVANIVLAAILFEEAFALMAIVTAIMIGLGMFSDIGLQPSVTQNARGDDPDFLNTAWTLQVIRGVALFAIALALAWPLSSIYGANDPKAYALLYLIPLVALTAITEGFASVKVMTAARHLRVTELTKIELIIGPFSVGLMLLLAWYMRSVYALAIASVLSSLLHLVLTYRMLDGQKSRFRWDPSAVKAIIYFGKWVFLSSLITFLAMQMDRLAFAGMFNLADVGVYSIAASLAAMVPTMAGKLQSSLLFPWYSHKLAEGMPLPEAFGRTRIAMMAFSSYLCALLFAGAGSFFALAYDERYAAGAVLLPLLSVGAWFACMESMYVSTFLATGRTMWVAMSSASKVLTFALSLVVVSLLKLDIVAAAVLLSVTEVLRWLLCQGLGRRLGLRNAKVELAMFAFFMSVSLACWALIERVPLVSHLHPFWRLAVLGTIVSLLFVPLFWRFVLPLVRQR